MEAPQPIPLLQDPASCEDAWAYIMDILCPKYLRKEVVIRSTELIPLLNLACTSKTFNELVTHRIYKIKERNIVRMSSQIDICRYLAANGWLSLLQEAFERGYEMDYDTTDNAAYSDHLDCLKYARECGCEWDEETMMHAASSSTECLIYLFENGCPWDSRASEAAALSGSLERLQYIHKNGGRWSSKTCANAAKISLECLKYCHENGCEWDESTCLSAANNNQLSSLQYAVENGCPLDTDTCFAAALTGALLCLEYAHRNGCELTTNTCSAAVRSHSLECLIYIVENATTVPQNILETAAFQNNEPAVEYLVSKGFKWISSKVKSKEVGDYLTLACNIEGLKLAYKYGCPLSPSIMRVAAESGASEVVKFAMSLGHTFTQQDMEVAICKGYLDVVKVAHEGGCPLPITTMRYAARSLDVLKYAHEHGCAFLSQTVTQTLYWDKPNNATYAIENGAYWCAKEIRSVSYGYHRGIVCVNALLEWATTKYPAQQLTQCDTQTSLELDLPK